MDRILIAIGGGNVKDKETLKIDEQIVKYANERTEGRRAVALFIGTASHDSMPYYNSFHKIYTGVFNVKTDCLLIVNNSSPDLTKIQEKFNKADIIYVGGGDTVFMINKWKEYGIYDMIFNAYNRGAILCGLSAGAICWFKNMFTDSFMLEGKSDEYGEAEGIGLIDGSACPHFNERKDEFINKIKDNKEWVCIDNLSAVVYKNEQLIGSLNYYSGKSYLMKSGQFEIINEI